MKKLCALVIGHKKRSPGAVNKNQNLSEFVFNDDLAVRIERKVKLCRSPESF
jgi:N-acetylmuramoyl-L-alanine amidase